MKTDKDIFHRFFLCLLPVVGCGDGAGPRVEVPQDAQAEKDTADGGKGDSFADHSEATSEVDTSLSEDLVLRQDTQESSDDIAEVEVTPPGVLQVQGRLRFERRLPDPTRSFLDIPAFAPLRRHPVLVLGPDQDLRIFTDDDGRFSFDLPSNSSRITVVVSAILEDHSAPDSPPLAAVFDGVSSSLPPSPGIPLIVSRPWSWSFDIAISEDVDLGDLDIRIAKGSGALAILDTFARTRDLVLETLPSQPIPSLAFLWSPERTFSCLSCYLPGQYGPVLWSSPAGTLTLDRALFVSGSPSTPHHWVTPILNHELGHWVADTFSRLPDEGGPHAWDSRVRPELAQAEGFATFFALWVLAHEPSDAPERFFSIQQNIEYWIDFERLGEISPNIDFDFPLPTGNDLSQDLNESVVVSILWDLYDPPDLSPITSSDDDACALGVGTIDIISHPRILLPDLDRGAPGPDLVDYLDALACRGELPGPEVLESALFGFPYDYIPLCPTP